MEIVNKPIEELKAYKNNPRRNGDAVKYVANSIEQFGFNVPIVVDKNNCIVCGHTRLLAAQQLGLSEVPCVIVNNLTEEQVNAFRIADNKVSEAAKWNVKLLQEEMKLLPEFNFADFGFKMPERKESHRTKTVDGYNLQIYDSSDAEESRWGIPELDPIDFVPSGLIGFNYAKSTKETSSGLHFYLDDYQFERLWNKPDKYDELISQFSCTLTPDFSLYLDMPMAMQIWNVYRSRLLGRHWQDIGLNVIPTVSWSTAESYDFSFDGIPRNSTVSISTIGVKRESEAFQVWKNGTKEMIERLQPMRILVYGGKLDFDYGNIEVIYYDNSVIERVRKGR